MHGCDLGWNITIKKRSIGFNNTQIVYFGNCFQYVSDKTQVGQSLNDCGDVRVLRVLPYQGDLALL